MHVYTMLTKLSVSLGFSCFLSVRVHVQCFRRCVGTLKTQPLFKKNKMSNSYSFGENHKNV